MYLYFLFWMNLEVESIIQWIKHPPDIAPRIKSVYSHPFLVLTSMLCWTYFPSPFPVGCSPSLAGLTAPLLLGALSNICLTPWGASSGSSASEDGGAAHRRGGRTWPFLALDFPANSSSCFRLAVHSHPQIKSTFLIHDLILHIIFQPSCMIGSQHLQNCNFPASSAPCSIFFYYYIFGLITTLATYVDTVRHIMKAQTLSQEKQSYDLCEANSPKLPGGEHRSLITAGLFRSWESFPTSKNLPSLFQVRVFPGPYMFGFNVATSEKKAQALLCKQSGPSAPHLPFWVSAWAHEKRAIRRYIAHLGKALSNVLHLFILGHFLAQNHQKLLSLVSFCPFEIVQILH